MQVGGYGLDSQKDKLRKFTEFQEMQIIGEYSDEGEFGKNVEGRPEFLKMLREIETGKNSVINVRVEFGEDEGKEPLNNIAKRAATYKLKESYLQNDQGIL